MSLSLERLQTLLKEDATRRREREQKEAAHEVATRDLRDSIQTVWRAHGLLAPATGTWVRPIHPSLYKCPLSEQQTTLVPWKSLPRKVQAKVSAPDDGENGIVEVPLAYLAAGEDEGLSHDAGGSLLQKRPLGGNLTTKLSEYTRGISGQSRPFRPGGLGTEEASAAVDEYRTPEAIQRAQEVVQKGSEASWKDGTILTAPPGVDFKVGLSWEDLYGEGDVGATEQETYARLPIADEHPQYPVEEGTSTLAPLHRPKQATPGMFSRAYFDDDSLFGSSSESDFSDEEVDDSGIEGEREESPFEEAASSFISEVPVPVPNRDEISTGVADEVSMDEDEVDVLLTELTLSSDKMFAKRKATKEISTNPLELAERQAKYQSDNARKAWASTKLLPIHDFNSLVPNPAMVFPFTLDDFQQQAIARLERSESVFVAAHTSAGKTVVAEYAVALARQRATRCVYTSPIKALSNQKFRDFSAKFGSENVGLITGDLQVNVDDSTCLIMTTEILRSMLYRGADLIRDIEWVIWDEVHYLNDSERGVVWEESIIMLPSYVNFVFLSATTPNTLDFSEWVGRVKRKPVHVIRTNYRPVPLSHNLWAGLKLHKILEGNGAFVEKGYMDAKNALLPSSAKDKSKKPDQKARSPSRPATGSKQLAWQAQGSKQNWMSLVRFLDRELLTPAVIFSFSKKKCEEIANMLRSLDLNMAKERSAVRAFTIQTVARLSENDSRLPQVLMICEMVERGIGVHHGGLLPILKEMVEILFSRNLIKVLFATETFAMGVNMPAKAVVFNSIRKHDGNQFRVLEPGEYTQMAGRAGRRGLDKIGTVIVCCFGEVPPPQPILRHMLTGSSTRLSSQFRLTWNMILNLLRVEEMSVESMIRRSFSEFATQRALTANDYPQLLSRGERTLAKLEEKFRADSVSRMGAEDIEQYSEACNKLIATNKEVLSYIKESESASFDEIVQPGRVVLVTAAREYGIVRAPAIVLRAMVAASSRGAMGGKEKAAPEGIICILLMPASFIAEEPMPAASQAGRVGYVGNARQRYYAIREIDLHQILLVSSKKHKVDAKDILKDEASSHGRRMSSSPRSLSSSGRDAANPFAGMKSLRKSDALSSGGAKLDQAIDRTVGYLVEAEETEFCAGISALDLRSFVIRGSDVVYFRRACDDIDELIVQIRSFASHRHPNLEKYYSDIERKEMLRSKVETLRHLLSNESLQLFPDFLQRKAVLRKLGYVDENETVCIKGRVACEVNTCDELIATEMVFEGLLNDLDPEEIVAVLSSLVFQEKSDQGLDAELPEKLVLCCEQMKTLAINLGQLQKEQGLDVDPREFSDESIKFGLVHVVYEWALGVPFQNICELTDVQEGSIVRCITRLDELCREVRNCARVVGNPTLYRKLEAASAAIKRDIVFAASLYVS